MFLKLDTLSKFQLQIHGVPSRLITTDLEKEICGMICLSAAEAIKIQCGRQHDFADDGEQ